MTMPVFYVYEHVRKDSGQVFYVGKGSGYRIVSKQGRNPYWRRVAEKAGYDPRIVFRTDCEELAFFAEQELIDKHRRSGLRLANMTDGGEGRSGFKPSPESIKLQADRQRGQKRPAVSAALKGRVRTPEHSKRISEAKKGVKASDAARLAMSISRKGRPSTMLGKKHREESKRKTSDSMKGDRNHFYGKSHTSEAIEKIRAANLGKEDSSETRARKSAAHSGPRNRNFGKPVPLERKLKQIAALKARPRVACPHCARVMDDSNAKRWHFDNCKMRID